MGHTHTRGAIAILLEQNLKHGLLHHFQTNTLETVSYQYVKGPAMAFAPWLTANYLSRLSHDFGVKLYPNLHHPPALYDITTDMLPLIQVIWQRTFVIRARPEWRTRVEYVHVVDFTHIPERDGLPEMFERFWQNILAAFQHYLQDAGNRCRAILNKKRLREIIDTADIEDRDRDYVSQFAGNFRWWHKGPNATLGKYRLQRNGESFRAFITCGNKAQREKTGAMLWQLYGLRDDIHSVSTPYPDDTVKMIMNLVTYDLHIMASP